MKKLFAVIAMLAVLATGAFAMDFGIGYVKSANMDALTFTYDPIPLITVQAGISLFNAGLNDPSLSVKSWTSPNPEPAWNTDTASLNAAVNGGSFGVRCLFNLQRPTPNTKFYAGLGIDILFLTLDVALPDSDLKVNGGGYAVDLTPVAGFEYRLKEIPNLGLYAEIGYDLTIAGSISGGYTSGSYNGRFQINPNAYLGRTFWGIGATWYF